MSGHPQLGELPPSAPSQQQDHYGAWDWRQDGDRDETSSCLDDPLTLTRPVDGLTTTSSLGQFGQPPSLGQLGQPPISSFGQLGQPPMSSFGQLGQPPISSLGQFGQPPITSLGQFGPTPISGRQFGDLVGPGTTSSVRSWSPGPGSTAGSLVQDHLEFDVSELGCCGGEEPELSDRTQQSLSSSTALSRSGSTGTD